MAKDLENMARRTISPPADICEDNGSVILRLEMPGIGKDDIDIRIENDELFIRGLRKNEVSEGTYVIRERSHADYMRKYTLDETIDREKIDAVMKNGVLMLTLHTKEAAKPKKIEIKVK
jgi:HSP20 family protein